MRRIILIGSSEDKANFSQKLKAETKNTPTQSTMLDGPLANICYGIDVNGQAIVVWDMPAKKYSVVIMEHLKKADAVILVSPKDQEFQDVVINAGLKNSVHDFDVSVNKSPKEFIANLLISPKLACKPE